MSERDTKQNVRTRQEKSNESFARRELAGFGGRLREAFGGAKNVEIARRLGVTEAAVRNYLEGRVPPAETLLLIADRTSCSLDWLLINKGPRLTPTGGPGGDTEGLKEENGNSHSRLPEASEQSPGTGGRTEEKVLVAHMQLIIEQNNLIIELLKDIKAGFTK